MAGIWFAPENSAGVLISPIEEASQDTGFYTNKDLYFYCRFYLSSSHADQTMNLVNLVSGNDSTLATFDRRTHVYLAGGGLHFWQGDLNVITTGSGSMSVPVPTDQINEIVVTATQGRGNTSEDLLFYLNGVLQANIHYHANFHSFYPYSRVFLGGNYQGGDVAKGINIIDFTLTNRWRNNATPASLSTDTHTTIWRGDFEDTQAPLKIITNRNTVSSELVWTITGTDNVFWHSGDEVPSETSLVTTGAGNG
ncbi:MAG: hypothetical protein ACR2PT_18745 [Endozoicomonas sp.]